MIVPGLLLPPDAAQGNADVFWRRKLVLDIISRTILPITKFDWFSDL